MSSFDADLVRRWFSRLRDAEQPVMPHWGITPTAQEAIVLLDGETQLRAALDDDDLPLALPPGAVIEVPAVMLQRYLHALAAGMASTRQIFSQTVDGLPGDGLPDAGAMELAAGLNAGAAALLGFIRSSAYAVGREWRTSEPSAAESARMAGVAAAELVVDGADLHDVAETAAGVAMSGWRIGLPQDPADRIEYRARGLVGLVLAALEIETRAPEPPAAPASCGALPGQNLGRQLAAEITFSMGLEAAEIRALSADLAQFCTEVTVWPGGQWPRFHLHTEAAGDVVGQVYAYGTPFDLVISERP
ncbi:MAG: hypothetical protein ABWZ02_10365 [Nakamurella sp.]